MVVTFEGVVDWRSRKQKLTAQSTSNAEYYAIGVGCMRPTQISHLLNELGILSIPHVFSDSQSLIPRIKNSIYRRTAIAYIATKYYLAADMARDREIDLSYVRTAEMLADSFTKPLPKPVFLKQCAVLRMIGIGLGNSLTNGLGKLGNVHGNGVGNGNRFGNAVGK